MIWINVNTMPCSVDADIFISLCVVFVYIRSRRRQQVVVAGAYYGHHELRPSLGPVLYA